METRIEVSGKEKRLFEAGEAVEGWRARGEDFGDNKDMIMFGGYAVLHIPKYLMSGWTESGPDMEENGGHGVGSGGMILCRAETSHGNKKVGTK